MGKLRQQHSGRSSAQLGPASCPGLRNSVLHLLILMSSHGSRVGVEVGELPREVDGPSPLPRRVAASIGCQTSTGKESRRPGRATCRAMKTAPGCACSTGQRWRGHSGPPPRTRCPVNQGFVTRLIFGWEGQAGCFKPGNPQGNDCKYFEYHLIIKMKINRYLKAPSV